MVEGSVGNICRHNKKELIGGRCGGCGQKQPNPLLLTSVLKSARTRITIFIDTLGFVCYII
jgi:hypothetical protein